MTPPTTHNQIQLEWRTSLPAFAYHLCAHLSDGKMIKNELLQTGLFPLVAEIDREVKVIADTAKSFWDHLIPSSTEIEDKYRLARTAIQKGCGRTFDEIVVERIVAQLWDVESICREVFPGFEQSLRRNVPPIQTRWDECGPTLLHRIGEQTDPGLIIDRARVILLPPVVQRGDAHLPYRAVRFEVSSQSSSRLIPILRLAWYLSQLNHNLPQYGESIHPRRRKHVAGYAMLPAVLLAATGGDADQVTESSLGQILAKWRCHTPPDINVAKIVADWWQSPERANSDWATAIQTLDRAFG